MIYAWGNCCHIGSKALATKLWQILGLLSIPWGNIVYWKLLWGSIWLGQGREKVNLFWSKGCKGILKKQSCKSVIILCQFWGIVIGDGISGCNSPIGLIDALTFLKKEMATHSIVLAWRIPVTAEPGGLPSVGSHRIAHDCSDLAAGNFSKVSETPFDRFLFYNKNRRVPRRARFLNMFQFQLCIYKFFSSL